MGYLLKEALKTLCGVNQWDYAIFWKIGCQNPTLLIWEECYHAPVSCSSVAGISGIESSRLAFEDWESCSISHTPQLPQVGVLAEDKVHSLINKMILTNRVKIVGQGLVGRTAFTGNHLWILSETYTKETQPPEVQNEVYEQFSANLKTLAVIPIFTHGVVQFGSSSAIMEDMTFVNDVKNLILQVGCGPGAFLSDNYISKEPVSKFEMPLFRNETIFTNLSGNGDLNDFVRQQSVLSEPSEPNRLSYSTVTQLQTNQQVNDVKPQDDICLINAAPIKKRSLPLSSQINNNGRRGVEVLPSNPELWLNQQPSLQNQRSRFDGQPCVGPSSANYSSLGIGGEDILSDFYMQEYVRNGMGLSESINCQLATGGSLSPSAVPLHGGVSDDVLRSLLNPTVDTHCSTPTVSGLNEEDKRSQVEVARRKEKVENDPSENVFGIDHFIQRNVYGNQGLRPGPSGDDLFDILGSDFKSKLFGSSWTDSSTKNVPKNKFTPDHHQYADSDVYSVREGNSDDIFSCTSGTDHLLDAVVSRTQSGTMQKLDNGVSCGTTLANVGSSSVANASPSCSQHKAPDQMQGKLSGLPMSLAKLAGIGSVSFKSEKEDTGSFSQSSSVYGSQVSSWVEQGPPSVKQNSSGSKRADEVGKSNRKRLKPGENPRPRPKDRQMIQDRMKELREIVPNGAKLSIDALLERTIKHMLFLQSVTKHADKLKQNGESEIINKDGGLVLRDGFEGGRTWACEVGSQNMVWPIIVEDLNPPRQMLVEMLCEQRGLFLEIADIIRGLGLTILKGVMETRNNKIWARFAVEADRDVTRMEIFLSLVHLLEQTIKSIPSSCNGIDSNGMSLHQVTSIPATGRPSSLQ